MGGILWSLSDVYLGSDHLPRLEKITLDIKEGRTAIVGPSGAGKTSLLNILVGFEQPDRGTVSRIFTDTGHSLPLFWVPQGQGLWPHSQGERAPPNNGCAGQGDARKDEKSAIRL